MLLEDIAKEMDNIYYKYEKDRNIKLPEGYTILDMGLWVEISYFYLKKELYISKMYIRKKEEVIKNALCRKRLFI